MYLRIGRQQYYLYTGTHAFAADKETVVFVHGVSMDHSVWSQQSRYFAYHGYNVAAVDLPGHCFSGGMPLDSIDTLAVWLRQIIARSGGRAVHLIGHSMGALIVLAAAHAYTEPLPADNANDDANEDGHDDSHEDNHDDNHNDTLSPLPPLASLALIGFSYPMVVAPALLARAKDAPQEAYAMMIEWSHCSLLGGEPMPGFWARGMQQSMMANNPPAAVLQGLLACDRYRGGEAAMAAIDCPIFMLSGQHDKMAPAKGARAFARRRAEQNKPVECTTLPNCGHSLLAESPDGVLVALRTFITAQST